MPSRFRPGAAAYAKDGRRYIVEDVADGIVYCVSDGGAETEFPEAQLMNEAEWTARAGGRPEMIYGRIRQARAWKPPPGALDAAAAEALLGRAERVRPGLLDFVAFEVARRVVEESGEKDFVAVLSIKKCRAIFDAAPAAARAAALAALVGAPPDRLASASGLGDNLLRAMLDKGLGESAGAFEEFRERRRQ